METLNKNKALITHEVIALYNHRSTYHVQSGTLISLRNWMRESCNEAIPTLIEASIEAIPSNASIEATRDPLLYFVQLVEEWKIHSTFLEWLKGYFPDLEATVEGTGLRIFKDRYISLETIRSMLIKYVVDNKEFSVPLIKRMRKMLIMTKMIEDFGIEQHSSEELGVSCRDKAKQLIESCDCGDYLREAEKCMKEEIEKVCHHFDGTIIEETINVVTKEMIESHMDRLVRMENSGLAYMVNNDKFEDLHRMYNLMRRLPHGLALMAEVMTAHIRAIGGRIVTDPVNIKIPVCFVQRLLVEKDKYDNIISSAFNNDRHFHNDLSHSFKYIVNLNNLSPYFISLFLDKIVRKRLKGVTEENEDIVLDKVIWLFALLQNKYGFEKYYREHLTKRLLSGTCDETERRLILKFQRECGRIFTSKLESMTEDIRTSQAMLQTFHADVGAETADGPAFDVKILKNDGDCWSLQRSATKVTFPPELVGFSNRFISYHRKTHENRRVWWEFKMGTADLIAAFGNGQKHELKVSTYQMCILMLFNNADRLSYKEIEQATKIPKSELMSCLRSLTSVEGKNVLCLEKNSEDITEDAHFIFNDSFSSNMKSILVAEPAQRPEVQPDRSLEIRAKVMKIMKSCKELTHEELIKKVNRAFSGKTPRPKDIKKELETLIEKEYIIRHLGGYQYRPK